MMTTEPILTTWDGTGFVPERRHTKRCDAEFVCGERYFVEPIAPRNMAAHRFYFAALRDAWINLPEDQAERFGSPEALRKYALVMTGFRDERTFVAASKAEAFRLAAFMRPMDDTAVISVREAVVRCWTPKSQSVKAMGKTDFYRSKDDVLAF